MHFQCNFQKKENWRRKRRRRMKWTSIDQCLVAFEKRYQRQHQHQHQQHRSTNGVPIELLHTHTLSPLFPRWQAFSFLSLPELCACPWRPCALASGNRLICAINFHLHFVHKVSSTFCLFTKLQVPAWHTAVRPGTQGELIYLKNGVLLFHSF